MRSPFRGVLGRFQAGGGAGAGEPSGGKMSGPRQGRHAPAEDCEHCRATGYSTPTILSSLPTIELADLPHRQRQALAAGAGLVVEVAQEPLGTPDELVASALPSLARLRALAALADASDAPDPVVAGALARTAAATLRLLDRALVAHGRAHRYPIGVWRERASRLAHAAMSELEAPPSCAWVGMLVDEAVDAVADATTALHHDRLGVPEALTEAGGLLLVVHLAAAPDA
jgi:hypothetical protein